MYGACDLVVAAVRGVLVVEIPLACCCADRANVFDCVCHGVLSEVGKFVGFEERDLIGGGAAKRHHVLLDVGLQLGAVRWCRQFAIGEDEFGHDLLSIDKEKNNGASQRSRRSRQVRRANKTDLGTFVPGSDSGHEFAALCGGQFLECTNGSGNQIDFFLASRLAFADSGDHALQCLLGSFVLVRLD